eukprot:TRINITY_DN63660_c0_g1_i1.p1 TRINITY_DN63660_c0_g1~~TRINITY_DN63660_c0_g1_i1.p1  ORF type:complete len:378 (+),score=107.26 TRINITY_DN63660_c0_g1_i1:79-1212(+)
MPRRPIVGGNWKCNPKTLEEAEKLVSDWKKLAHFDKRKIDVFACPMLPHLMQLKPALERMGISACAQNCSKTGEGAFTGEVSCAQLKDSRVGWTLIGHSERRTKYGETDEDVAEKVSQALAAKMKVVLAIGELLEEREAGKTDEVNSRMLDAVIKKVKPEDWRHIVIAYEPVWAIGTGKVATPEQAEETHAAIRAFMAKTVSEEVAEKVRIQYGGSVTAENCAELIKKPNIDGFLVGGASLKPSFMEIVQKSVPVPPLKKPKFSKVKDLDPVSKGFNVMVKCVKAAEAVSEGMWEATVGDETGTCIVSFRNQDLCGVCKEGASLRIQNTSSKMIKGYIRLQVDKWAAFKTADEALDFTVDTNAKLNVSATEYELVQE